MLNDNNVRNFKPAGAGAPVLRAVPAGGVKRVRVIPAQAIQSYNSAEEQQALGQQLVQQPAYFVQRAPVQVAKQTQIVKGRPAYQSQEEVEEEYAPDVRKFAYAITK